MNYIYLDAQKLTERIGDRVVVLDSVTSTNDYLEQAYLAGQNIRLVTVEGQSQGKGRLDGRVFFSPKYTGIYMSMLADVDCPLADGALLTPAVAVATCNAIQKVTGIRPSIKWINDLYIAHKKLSGILCKVVQMDSECVRKLIVGIGINVNRPIEPIPVEIDQKLAFLSEDIVIDRNALIAEIYAQVQSMLTHLDKSAMLAQYRQDNFLIDQIVEFRLNDATHQGVVVDIDDSARLVVQCTDNIYTLDSGEVSLTAF